MLSILIPVYQFDPTILVRDLHQQAKALKLPFEIRIYDDGSGDRYPELEKLSQQHQELLLRYQDENRGRSGIRNLLAAEARFDWLLFMDADSALVHDQYLEIYLQNRQEGVLLNGGTAYRPEKPSDQREILRWVYGHQREQRLATVRSIHPFEGFSTHHFFCHREVFEHCTFPEEVKGYGHEDTLFGFALQEKGYGIEHLDNPLYHIGLESHEQYLSKTKEAIRNLVQLRKTHPQLQTKLSRVYDVFDQLKLAWLLVLFHRLFESLLVRQLKGNRPLMFLLDLYKLGWIAIYSGK